MHPRTALRLVVVTPVALLALAHASRGDAQAREQFVPANSYWVGPNAASGSGTAAGMLDYLHLLNARDGGIHGVRFTWSKCDTRQDNARGLECYERAKAHPPTGATLIHPLTTPITYLLIDRASADRIPVVSIGYGRTDAADGRVFPYVFPLVTTVWDQAAVIVRYAGESLGGMANLRGRRIVLLYEDSAYGKEPIPTLIELASRYGFSLSTLAVDAPGAAQDEEWQRIRRIRPDWIVLWSRGEMTRAALKNAARAGFPPSRILGGGWSGAEEDVAPAGRAAQDYVAAGFNAPGDDFPVIRDIRRIVYGGEGGELDDVSRITQRHARAFAECLRPLADV